MDRKIEAVISIVKHEGEKSGIIKVEKYDDLSDSNKQVLLLERTDNDSFVIKMINKHNSFSNENLHYPQIELSENCMKQILEIFKKYVSGK